MNPVGMRIGPVEGIIPYIGGPPCAGTETFMGPFGIELFGSEVGGA